MDEKLMRKLVSSGYAEWLEEYTNKVKIIAYLERKLQEEREKMLEIAKRDPGMAV